MSLFSFNTHTGWFGRYYKAVGVVGQGFKPGWVFLFENYRQIDARPADKQINCSVSGKTSSCPGDWDIVLTIYDLTVFNRKYPQGTMS